MENRLSDARDVSAAGTPFGGRHDAACCDGYASPGWLLDRFAGRGVADKAIGAGRAAGLESYGTAVAARGKKRGTGRRMSRPD